MPGCCRPVPATRTWVLAALARLAAGDRVGARRWLDWAGQEACAARRRPTP